MGGKIEVYRSGDQFYWRYKKQNGRIVAQGEGYKRRSGLLKTVRPIAAALEAKLVVLD